MRQVVYYRHSCSNPFSKLILKVTFYKNHTEGKLTTLFMPTIHAEGLTDPEGERPFDEYIQTTLPTEIMAK